MKKRLLVTLGLMINILLTANAQNLIGQTKETILSYMATNKPTYKVETIGDPNTNKRAAIMYTSPANEIQGYAFENSKYCTSYLIIYKPTELNKIVHNFNNTFVKHGNLEWLNYDVNATYLIKVVRGNGKIVVEMTLYEE